MHYMKLKYTVHEASFLSEEMGSKRGPKCRPAFAWQVASRCADDNFAPQFCLKNAVLGGLEASLSSGPQTAVWHTVGNKNGAHKLGTI